MKYGKCLSAGKELSVDAQKGSGNPEMAPESAEAPMPLEGAGTDEEFLKSIAEQGSVR